jgi:hypothetical protein
MDSYTTRAQGVGTRALRAACIPEVELPWVLEAFMSRLTLCSLCDMHFILVATVTYAIYS